MNHRLKTNLMIAVAMMSATILGGCLGNEPEIYSSIENTTTFEHDDIYSWPFPTTNDASGNATGRIDPRTDLSFPWAVQQLVPQQGAAPALALGPSSEIFLTSFDYLMKSTNYGVNWTVANMYTTKDAPQAHDRLETRGGDLFYDEQTNRIYWGNLNSDRSCTDLKWSTDLGKTWPSDFGQGNRTYASCGAPFLNYHTKVFVGKYNPSAIPSGPVGAMHPNVVYICMTQTSIGPTCAASFDGGMTFVQGGTMRHPTRSADCTPITFGKPMAYPDGTIAMAIGRWLPVRYYLNGNPDCRLKPTVAISNDYGLTWTLKENTAAPLPLVETDPRIVSTADGTSYLIYRASDQFVYMLRSKDKFSTWEGPFRVSPFDHTMNMFAAITAGDNGKVAVAYLGTTSVLKKYMTEPERVGGNVFWHLFVSTSYNADSAAPTFQTQQVTPIEDPVQAGCIAYPGYLYPMEGPGYAQYYCYNLLGFIDMGHDKAGRFYVTFGDGCTLRNGCTGDTDGGYSARERQSAVAVQDHGRSLIGDEMLEPLGLSHPRVYVRVPRE
jgi:hypothetical protein